MPSFVIEYWAEFYGEWRDYKPVTFNARTSRYATRPFARRYATREQAESALTSLQKDWPRDKFRIATVSD